MFKKILAPTDGSRYSAEAAKIAANLAQQQGGTVQPLVAVEYQYVSSEDLPEDVRETIRQKIHARATKAVEEAANIAREAGAAVANGKIVEGRPAEVILQEAADGDYDLIVMGSRGVSRENGYQRLVGSVAEQVIHATPCPVLLVRAEPLP